MIVLYDILEIHRDYPYATKMTNRIIVIGDNLDSIQNGKNRL